MIKVLIVTHGKLAEGIVNTLNMLIGDKQDITYINALLIRVILRFKLKIF